MLRAWLVCRCRECYLHGKELDDLDLTSQGCDSLKRPDLPPLRAIIPTYIVGDFDLFDAPTTAFDTLCDLNAVIAEAKQDVRRQACGVTFRSNPHFSFA